MTAQAPTFTVLLDWVEGRLDPAQAEAVSAYLDTAEPRSLETVSWIRSFLVEARRMPLQRPPAELSTRLRDMFVEMHRPERAERWSDASLLYDTRTRSAAGVRSVGGDDRLHLAFDSDLGRFVIEVAPAAPGEVHLEGLIMVDPSSTGVDLAFYERGALRRASRASVDGRFDVAGVPLSVDELWLTAGDVRVRAALDLRST